MARKEPVTVNLEKIHLKLIEDLKPAFGNHKSEVVRTIVVRFLIDYYEKEGLKEKGGIK